MEYKYYKYVLVVCTIFYYLMSYKMEHEQPKLIEDDVLATFNLLDTDNDATLKPSEFAFLATCVKQSDGTEASITKWFNTKKKNKITLQEFRYGIREYLKYNSQRCRSILNHFNDPLTLSKLTPIQKQKIAYQIFDLNRDKHIEWDEFRLVNAMFMTDYGESITVFNSLDSDSNLVIDKKEL